jgi:hypothetical protein
MMLPVKERHYCRNPRCRSKLKAPVANPRQAFCTRGCFRSFFHRRCIVCEREIERKTEHQRCCERRKCWADFKRDREHYLVGMGDISHSVIDPLTNPIKPGLKSGGWDGRPVVIGEWREGGDKKQWRQIAGPLLSPRSFHLATLPLHRSYADYLRRVNRAPENPAALFQRNSQPLNLVGGYRFPNAPDIGTDLAVAITTTEANLLLDQIEDAPPLVPDIAVEVEEDGLDIPEFLRRG